MEENPDTEKEEVDRRTLREAVNRARETWIRSRRRRRLNEAEEQSAWEAYSEVSSRYMES